MNLLTKKRRSSRQISNSNKDLKNVFHLFIKWYKDLHLLTAIKKKQFELMDRVSNLTNSFDLLDQNDDYNSFFNNYTPFVSAQIDFLSKEFQSKQKLLIREVSNNVIYKKLSVQHWDSNDEIPIHFFNNSITVDELLVLLGKRILMLEDHFDMVSCHYLEVLFQKINIQFIKKIKNITKKDGINTLKISLMANIFGFFDYEDCLSLEKISDNYCSPIFPGELNYYRLQLKFSTLAFTKQALLNYLLSPLIVKIYQILLHKKQQQVTTSFLKQLITDIINNTQFFFIPKQIDTFGYTIENGNIYLEKPTVLLSNLIPTLDAATLLSTLIHEIGHSILQRIIKQNFYIEHLKIKNHEHMDSGEYVEYLMFHNEKEINLEKAYYILELQNYYKSRKEFLTGFSKITYTKREKTMKFRKKRGKKCGTWKNAIQLN